MSVLVLATVLLCIVSIVFIILIVLRLRCPIEEPSPEWLETFSLGPYRPLLEALGDCDFSFVSREAGFQFGLHRRIQHQRARVFRDFLNRYVRDYNRLHALARATLVCVNEDRSDVMIRLIQLRVAFSLSLFRAELGYALSRTGLGSASAQILLSPLERINGSVCKVIVEVATA